VEGFRAASPEIAALLEGVERRHLVRAEIREASYDRPLCERVASGVALDGLRYEGSAAEAGGERVLLFSGRRNDSRLRPGSRLRLSRGDARKPVARLELVGDRFEGGRYLFRLSGPVERTAELEAPGTWVFDEDEPDLLEAETEMLRLADKRGLGAWLCGAEPVLLDPAGDSPLGEGLSGSMGEAFRRALSAAAWFPVQGPPGSGKTHLLARLALHYARVEGLRVLITAVSHQAIHNALSETACLARKLPFDGREGVLSEGLFKLASSRGHNAGLPEGVRPVRGLPAARGPSIVGATVYSAFQAAARTAPSGPPFDAVLFDEAGQAHMVLALGARLLAPQAVFIGDDAQMPPVTESLPGGAEEEGERLSALGRLRRIYGEPFLLAQTRRLNEELCSVVSDCFYSGRLGPTPEAARRRLCLARPAGPAFSPILDPERSLVFLDVPHQGCRSVCEPEALWAAAIVREAARCGVPPEDIGVISPFRAQCNRIRFLLDDPARRSSASKGWSGRWW
jgi:DNA replication ATP-dependent helicase Dna2